MILFLFPSWSCKIINSSKLGPSPGTQVIEEILGVGGFHTCIRFVDGTAMCWGNNTSGQIGGGVCCSDVYSPRATDSFTYEATSIASGRYHSCVILKDGSVWCWGSNTYGQIVFKFSE